MRRKRRAAGQPRDKRRYEAPDKVRKAKRILAQLSSHDLGALRWWISREAQKVGGRERVAAGRALMDSVAVGDLIMLDPEKCSATSSRPVPGEPLSVLEIRHGRKHIGLWVRDERGNEHWLADHELARYCAYDAAQDTPEARAETERMRRMLGGVLGQVNRAAADLSGKKANR